MLTDCPRCWDSPCTCGYAYWFLPLDRVAEIARVARKVLGDRRGHRRPPQAVREELQRQQQQREAAKNMTSADWGRSFTYAETEIVTLLDQTFEARAPVPPSVLDAIARRKG